jgi:hypothetical protein
VDEELKRDKAVGLDGMDLVQYSSWRVSLFYVWLSELQCQSCIYGICLCRTTSLSRQYENKRP